MRVGPAGDGPAPPRLALCYPGRVSSDTKWIVGTGVAITAVVGTGGVLAGLLLAQIGAVNTRLDRLDDRLRAVEIGFAAVQQRLLTFERVVLPAAPAPGE